LPGTTALPPALALLRPRQWYKNLVVFIAIVFQGNVTSGPLWLRAIVCFAGFCMLSSSVYAANDALDAARDRLHPAKRHRPVASGAIPAGLAYLLSAVLAGAGLFVLWSLNATTLAAGIGYLLLQALYNASLKRLLLWDALAVAIGFVLRALAGTTALEAEDPTVWLIVCTFLFALYLALAKRRHELLLAQDDAAMVEHRPTLGGYTVPFVEQTMQTSATLLLAAYSLYTFFGADQWMMTTLPFAFYGVFRHTYLVHRRDLGDEAEMIFRDRATILNAGLWLLSVLAVQAHIPQDAYAWLESFN
jgi:4-hydroxybenzoate polyprenyltransferase